MICDMRLKLRQRAAREIDPTIRSVLVWDMERKRERDTEKQRGRERKSERDIEKQRGRERVRDREREREKDRGRERERYCKSEGRR